MDAHNFLFSFLLSTLILYSSASGEKLTLQWSRKHTTQHDTNFPTTTPAIVTVPSSTPVTVTPTTPATITPPSAPVVSPPATTGAPPTTNNPVTITPPSAPLINPPATTGAPPTINNPVTNTPPAAPVTNTGQRWCVAKSGAPDKSIQAALDYACGIGAADCSTIQQGASCYNPNTLQNHASYAFNSYYQRNPLPTSCDFGGAAALTTSNPSSGSCVYAASATTATPVSTTPTAVSPPTTTAPPISVTPPTMASPVTVNPTPTPTTTTPSSTGASPTPTGLGIPPSILNSSNPGMGGATAGFGIGDGSPVANMTTAVSASSRFEPFGGCIVAVAAIVVLGI
ncbi:PLASMODESMATA CALLOSE-BINDING PROTEIN 4-like [Salvia divinorum]|uniref:PLASMODESMATA CALLOSE-BINDING PROTEIN 4-like n=1 Tax=Salvia divinorum TaxID=28513 RepID=A0ABD1FTK2_SALDI